MKYKFTLPAFLFMVFLMAGITNVHAAGSTGINTERNLISASAFDNSSSITLNVKDTLFPVLDKTLENLNYSGKLIIKKRDPRVSDAWMKHAPIYSGFWKYFIESERGNIMNTRDVEFPANDELQSAEKDGGEFSIA